MRATVALILIAIATAFAAGYLALSYRTAPGGEPSLAQLGRATQRLLHERKPALRLSLPELYARAGRAELLDPRTHLPQSARYDYAEISALYRYARSCEPAELGHAGKSLLRKAWVWHRYRCGAVPELPENFFELPPFMHPSGSSFAYLAWRSGGAPFAEPAWLGAHLAQLHVGELADVPAALLDPARARLAGLDREGQAALAAGAPLVMSEQSLLVRAALAGGTRDEDMGDTGYAAYDLADALRFFAPYPASLRRASSVPGCLLRQGNVCWSFNTERVYRRARLPSLLLLAATALLTALLVGALVRRMREQRLEEQRRRFALQALTHELRTPVSSLRLSAEVLRGRFDELGPENQEAFLRVCDDLQRLQRLADTSAQYLGALEARRLIQLKPSEVDLDGLLRAAAEPSGASVEVDAGAARVRQDGYWLGLCVKNLLENAARHGKPPIRVDARVSGEELRITVSDGGELRAAGVDELILRGGQAGRAPAGGGGGLGLGLSLVARTAREMGGGLALETRPTRLILRLPRDLKGDPV